MKKNTYLGVDLKTQLQSDSLMTPGKDYCGVLRRDVTNDKYVFNDEHFTFVETLPSTGGKRNPKVFDGKLMNVTRREDGSLRLNFRPVKMDKGFSIEEYALDVANEIRDALNGLVEK